MKSSRLSSVKFAVFAAAFCMVGVWSAATSAGAFGQGEKADDGRQKLAALFQQIVGQENKPAEEVFKNIQTLKGVEAARLLRAMNSYSRALGVSCSHCHSSGQWERDDKPTKQTARDMISLMRTLNNDLLKKVRNLKNDSPRVTCTTCHRGQLKPEVELPETKPKSGGL